MFDIIIYRGDTKTFPVNVDRDGENIDITGATIYFTVKDSCEDLDSESLIKKVVTNHIDAVGGKSQISLTSSNTDIEEGVYGADIVIRFANGQISRSVGKITIECDYTREL